MLVKFGCHCIISENDSSSFCRKKHHSYLPKVVPSLLLLLRDDHSHQVQKKVIQTSCTLYREVVNWFSKSDLSSDENALMEVWDLINSLKTNIINLVDSDHDG